MSQIPFHPGPQPLDPTVPTPPLGHTVPPGPQPTGPPGPQPTGPPQMHTGGEGNSTGGKRKSRRTRKSKKSQKSKKSRKGKSKKARRKTSRR